MPRATIRSMIGAASLQAGHPSPQKYITGLAFGAASATPNALHAGHVRACLEAGKHVLCEKPFATTAREAEELFGRENVKYL